MESRSPTGDSMSQASPHGEGTVSDTKASKEKKTSTSGEMLAAAAIKDIKRPEGVAEAPKNTQSDLFKFEKTWLGSEEADTKAETPQHDDAHTGEITADTEHDHAERYNEVEHLTHGEARAVVSEYIDHRLPVIEQERHEATDDVHELAAISANEALLTRMRAEIDDEAQQAEPEELIDQAVSDVIHELGLGDTVAAREPEAVPAETTTLAQAEDNDVQLPETAPLSELPDQEPIYNTADGSGDGAPPHNPEYPFASDDEPHEPEHSSRIMTAPVVTEPAREITLQPPQPNERLERMQRDAERQQAMMRGMLVGGVIGYIIGRRRGRIKTERRLKPIQEKLQQEADTLRKNVATKEQTIRSLAREKSELEAQTLETKPRTSTKMPAAATPNRQSTVLTPEKTPDEIKEDVITNILAAPARPLEQSPALKAEIARNTVAQQLAVERPTGTAVDVVTMPIATRQLEQVVTPKTVESMPLPALIRASEKVVVEGKSLKSYFESGRIGEQGMRRVLTEHLRTGRTERALQTEILTYERRRKGSLELPAHTEGDEKALPAGPLSGYGVSPATSRHAPQSALVADDNGSRVVPPVKAQKSTRSASALAVGLGIVLLIALLYLVLK